MILNFYMMITLYFTFNNAFSNPKAFTVSHSYPIAEPKPPTSKIRY